MVQGRVRCEVALEQPLIVLEHVHALAEVLHLVRVMARVRVRARVRVGFGLGLGLKLG